MNEITELDDKYLVLKWTDITEGLNDENTKLFADLVQKIDVYRRLVRERPVNKYVVLNLDNKIDLKYLRLQIQKTIENKIFDRHEGTKNLESKVSDVATIFVNARHKNQKETIECIVKEHAMWKAYEKHETKVNDVDGEIINE